MVRVERRCILLLCVLENDNYNRHRGIIVRLVNPRCYAIALFAFRSFFFFSPTTGSAHWKDHQRLRGAAVSGREVTHTFVGSAENLEPSMNHEW